MRLSALTRTIREYERDLAPGSETALWGDYCEAMRKLTGHLPYEDLDEDPDVPAEEAEWWINRYEHGPGERR